MLGTIRDASYLGVSTSYIVEARGGGLITVYEQNVERATRAELWEPGEEVRMTWSPDHTFAVQAGGAPPPDVPWRPGVVAAAARRCRRPRGVSRRKFLVGGAVAVAAVGVVAFLANSSGGGHRAASPSGAAPRSRPVRGRRSAPAAERTSPSPRPLRDRRAALGQLDRLHRHRRRDGTYPTIQKFEAETGIKVTYLEDVDGNEEFFTASLSGPLNAGLPTEWDLVVLTDWMIDRLIRLGWLEALDRDAMPNFVANLEDRYVARSFDPDTKFAAPLAVRDDRVSGSTSRRPVRWTR